MSIFSNIRISDKLSALMGGLVLGFVLIGAAYFIQLNAGNKDRAVTDNQHKLRLQLIELRGISQSLLVFEDFDTQYDVVIMKALRRQLQVAELKLNNLVQTGTFNNVNNKIIYGVDTRILDNVANDLLAELVQINAVPVVSDGEIYIGGVESSAEVIGENAAVTKEININVNELNYVSLDPVLFSAQKVDVEIRALLENTSLATKVSGGNEAVTKENFVFTALLFTVAIATALGMYFIYKSIVFPMAHIQRVIRKINDGQTKARVGLSSHDELGDLGRAFNLLLDERIQVLETQSHENEKLNNSIISLIKSLGRIAQRDLTIKVPVSDDITGTVSDAVNLLTKETAKTLIQVKDISEKVNHVSERLQEQSSIVIDVAHEERVQVIATTKALELTAQTMNAIANEAESANEMANQTMGNTREALSVVTETVSGIRNIRETISETEKRIKRLGERSQEISGIVNLINSIAERTHILALNASMHAASAGEAGKGFAVVAEEVQRLAENSREATEEISSMVNNIRIETSDAVNTMNRLISQVADGSKLAEQAGKRMEETEASTQKLVDTVHNISKKSVSQAKFSNKVKDRATIIRRSTEKTGKQLQEQTKHTNDLKEYSQVLVERVNMFSLPNFEVDGGLLSKLVAPAEQDDDEHKVVSFS